MSELLDKPIVLSLNKNWLRLGWKTVRQAITDLCGGSFGGTPPAMAVAVTIDDNGNLVESIPMTWDEWVKLEVRPQDLAINTHRGPIRCPLVIVSSSYSKMPNRTPRLSNKAILERDGFTCAYTGEKLPKSLLNVDHVIPRDRGGRDSWENMVACRKDINSKKGNRLNSEVGLRLRKTPTAPKGMPVCATITEAKRPEHAPFIS